jgi:hypothetical protein
MISWESDALTPDQKEDFWQRIVDFGAAPLKTDFAPITEAGIDLPNPEALDDAQLALKLWEVVGALAAMRVFISETDHLSDRELYHELWHRHLREERPNLPATPASAWHVSPLGGRSETDTQQYLKYYADEDWRQHWLGEFPNCAMPAHEDPPFDRDRHLPQPYCQPVSP